MEALYQKIEGLEEQVRLLKKHVSQLQLQLKATGQDAVDFMTLEEAKEKMQAAVKRLMHGDLEAEKEFEKLDRAVKLHPDYIKEEEEKAARWAAEQQPKCQEALKKIRGFIPPDIVNTSKDVLIRKGVPREIAARVFSKKVLWFVRKHPSDIAKTHQADLNSKYTSLGLDIVEMRAVYAVLPEEFELDSDGKKAKWKHNFKQKMLELSTKEEGNRLMANEKRHNSYRKYTNLKPIFNTTTVKAAATTACTAFEPTKKLCQRSRKKHTHFNKKTTDGFDGVLNVEKLDGVSVVAVYNAPTRSRVEERSTKKYTHSKKKTDDLRRCTSTNLMAHIQARARATPTK